MINCADKASQKVNVSLTKFFIVPATYTPTHQGVGDGVRLNIYWQGILLIYVASKLYPLTQILLNLLYSQQVVVQGHEISHLML